MWCDALSETVCLHLITTSQQKQQLQIKTTICSSLFNILRFPRQHNLCGGMLWARYVQLSNPSNTSVNIWLLHGLTKQE